MKIFDSLLFFCVIFSVFIFMTGLHNFDLAQNIKWINAEYNLTLVDHATNGKYYTGSEGIQIGTIQMIFGFFLFGISIFYYVERHYINYMEISK